MSAPVECLMYSDVNPIRQGPPAPAAANKITRTPAPHQPVTTPNDCHDHWACEAYGQVCPSAARNAGRAARRALERISRDSRLFEEHPSGGGGGDAAATGPCTAEYFNVAQFSSSDLVVGRMLGRGGFSEVHEVRLLPSACVGVDSNGVDNDEGDNDDTTKEAPHPHRYVVKYLRRSVMVDRKKFARGAADLVIEASLLSAFDHPHIIRLHGVTAGPVEINFASGKDHGFFLVLDRLYDTLDNRMKDWKELSSKNSGFVYRAMHDPRGCKRRAALMDRLLIALSLADAVKYLHDRNVAFRDLKPENIGFDRHGELKLFDFGLAKELKPTRKLADGTYQLTGNTGSRRYMAPEVALVKPYNLSVDSYSFGILLWEICTLEKPFQGYTETNHKELVCLGGERPVIDAHGIHSYWPHALHDLIDQCWAQDMRDRPSFVDIIEDLNRCLEGDSGSSGIPGRLGKQSRMKRVGSIVRRSASDKLSSSGSWSRSSSHKLSSSERHSRREE